MMRPKAKILATLIASATLAAGVASAGSYFNQVSANWNGGGEYDQFGVAAPAGTYVFFETAVWGSGYAYATLGASGPGVWINSYVYTGGSFGDYGEQYSTGAGTISGTLTAISNGQAGSTAVIYLSW